MLLQIFLLMENKIIITCLLLCCSSCYKEDKVVVSDVIKEFTISPSALPADGLSKAQIMVILPDDVLDTKRSVVFTTTKGLFDIEAKNSVTVVAVDTMLNGRQQVVAIASLVAANEEGKALVTAKVQNFAVGGEVTFSRSYPNTISLNVDKLSVKGDAEIMVTTQLKRNTGRGKPSPGQEITLEAVDSSGNRIGNFRNLALVTDQDSKCVNYFSVPATSYYGPIVLRTTVRDSNQQVLTGTAFVNIIK